MMASPILPAPKRVRWVTVVSTLALRRDSYRATVSCGLLLDQRLRPGNRNASRGHLALLRHGDQFLDARADHPYLVADQLLGSGAEVLPGDRDDAAGIDEEVRDIPDPALAQPVAHRHGSQLV